MQQSVVPSNGREGAHPTLNSPLNLEETDPRILMILCESNKDSCGNKLRTLLSSTVTTAVSAQVGCCLKLTSPSQIAVLKGLASHVHLLADTSQVVILFYESCAMGSVIDLISV